MGLRLDFILVLILKPVETRTEVTLTRTEGGKERGVEVMRKASEIIAFAVASLDKCNQRVGGPFCVLFSSVVGLTTSQSSQLRHQCVGGSLNIQRAQNWKSTAISNTLLLRHGSSHNYFSFPFTAMSGIPAPLPTCCQSPLTAKIQTLLQYRSL